MKVILQHDERDCGAACLAMIAAHFGFFESISFFRELTHTDRSGANLYGLTEGAKKKGLEAEALNGLTEDLIKGVMQQEISFPFIAHTVSEDAMLHFVVVTGFKNGRFHIADPGKGRTTYIAADFLARWTGYMVVFKKSLAFKTRDHRKKRLVRFMQLLQGQYKKISGIIVLSLIIAMIGVVGSFVFEIVIDNFALTQTEEASEANTEITEAEHTHESDSQGQFLAAVGEKAERLLLSLENLISVSRFDAIFVALIGLYILRVMLSVGRGALVVSVSRKIDIRLSLAYYKHIVDLPISSILLRQTGEYMSRFSDASTIRNAISTATVTLVMDSLMVVASGVILFLLNRRMSFVTLLMVMLYAIVVLCYRKPIERANRNIMENNAIVESYLKESIDGIETTKALFADEQIKTKTTSKYMRLIQAVVKGGVISISQDALTSAIEMIGIAVILWVGFSMVLSEQIGIGALITFYALLSFFSGPIKNLIELQPTIQTALVAADRLNDIMDLSREENQASDEPLPLVSDWKISHVDFRYGNRALTLRDVSLEIHRGERIAVVGESGSGKTTLAKLMLRFYTPESGAITCDNRDIQSVPLAALRQSVAYVDQNTFLFADTIKNNLRLGKPDASDDELVEVCKLSHALEFIRDLPLGMDMPLDENGMNLSGGQRQRLAIARALLRKPQLLILDEATSNLDTVTENGVRDTVFNLNKELTCIVIAHRLSTIKSCDRIMVMERGSIVETGTHEELLASKGLYCKLWSSQ